MKILIIHAGTPINPESNTHKAFYEAKTITQGFQYFSSLEFVNNIQTRESLAANKNVTVHHTFFTGRKNIFNCIKGAWKIREIVKREKYEIVNQYWGGASSLFTAFFCPCTYIISLLGSDLYGEYNVNGKKTLKGKLLNIFSQLTCIFSTGIIVMSNKMKLRLWKISMRKAVVIPEGTDLSKFYPIDNIEAKQKLQWDISKKIVLFFPSHAYVKNMPLAIEAVKKLKQKFGNVELHLINNVAHNELIWYYNAADLLLITSFHEGSNNSIKEALACNLPVVSVNVGDAEERLENVYPSSLINDYDSEKISNAMHDILKSNIRSNGSEIIKEIELNTITNKIISYYKSKIN